MPNRTLANSKVYGIKNSKDRIIARVLSNASGNDICKVVIISKQKKPRCFQAFFNPNLFVNYFCN